MPFRYPVSLELTGRRCVVIGSGPMAEDKVGGLLEADAAVTVIGQPATEGLRELAEEGGVELCERSYADGDLAGAFLAIAATDDTRINGLIFAEAERGGVLLNAVDDIDHCHFAVPAVVRRDDFMMAISTGGKAPALAKRLRMRLADQFGTEYGALVNLLSEVREEVIPNREASFSDWARRWQLALDHDLAGLVRCGRLQEAKRVVLRALSGPEPAQAGRVWIVGAGPGDPGLLTVRGREALTAADVVVYDRLVPPELIDGAEAVYVGKSAGDHAVPQPDINDLLVDLARRGKRVVRLKGGDPFVFGRGAEEAEALAAAGVEFEVVPAPSSAIAALAYAGIPVTDRRFASSVAVVTGHCSPDKRVDWRALAAAVDTIVVLMGVGNLSHVVAELLEGGMSATTPAAVIQDGTLPTQRVVDADLGHLPAAVATAGIGTPAIVVIGEVVKLRGRIDWFRPSRSGSERQCSPTPRSSSTAVTIRSTSSSVL
jgi:uroporphyrin-III C-methyltransferase / precorrin-2 dehydrogenase / sirohydrochlorin ferrochelatase